MVAPSTLSLELLILFLSAGALALAGVLAMALVEPRRTEPAPPLPAGTRRSLAWGLLGGPFIGAGSVLLVGLGLLATVPLLLGSPPQLELAFAAGTLGSLGVTLLATGVTALAPRTKVEEPDETPTGRRSARGWMAAASVVSGAGGSALLTLVVLYIVLDGHAPALLLAALGAGLGGLTARLPVGARPDPTTVGAGPAARIRWVRDHAPIAVGRAVDLYLLFLIAPAAVSIVAFVPSVVRLLQPNAVLFPAAALATVFVASLVAVPFAPSGRVPTGSLRRVAEFGPAAFGVIALLALVPAYLPGGLGLFLGGAAGVIVLPVLTLLRSSEGVARVGSTRAGRTLIGAAIALVVVALVAVAFWSSELSVHRALDLSTSTIGTYGIGLAAVAATGTLGGLFAVDVGGRFAAALTGEGEASPGAPSQPAMERFGGAATVGSLVAGGLTVVTLLTGFVTLAPLEAGVAPGALVAALIGASEGGVLVGGFLGLLIPILTVAARTVWTVHAAPPAVPMSRPGPRNVTIRSVTPIVLGIALPIVGGEAFGAPGLVGVTVGALMGTLAAGFFASVRPGSSPDHDPVPVLLPALAVAALTAIAIGASLYSGRWL